LGKPFFHVRATFIWILIQITQVIQIIQLMWNILHGVFFFDDLLGHGSRSRGWVCDDVPFIVIILILIIVVPMRLSPYSSAISRISSSRDWIIPSRVVLSSLSL
jgi:uncharacterized membrane protein